MVFDIKNQRLKEEDISREKQASLNFLYNLTIISVFLNQNYIFYSNMEIVSKKTYETCKDFSGFK